MRIDEQPVLPSDDEVPNRTLGDVVADGHVALLDIPFQFAPVVYLVGKQPCKVHSARKRFGVFSESYRHVMAPERSLEHLGDQLHILNMRLAIRIL